MHTSRSHGVRRPTSGRQRATAAGPPRAGPAFLLTGGNGTLNLVSINELNPESRKKIHQHVQHNQVRQKRAVLVKALRKRPRRVFAWRRQSTPVSSLSLARHVEPSHSQRRPEVAKSKTPRSLNVDSTQSAVLSSTPSPRTDEKDGKLSQLSDSETSELYSALETELHASPNKDRGWVTSPMPKTSQRQATASPMSPLGVGEVDPFDCLPVNLKSSDRQMVHHYVSVLPTLLYQLPPNVECNPQRMVFRSQAMRDPLSFKTMLWTASEHLTSVNGPAWAMKSLQHKTEVIQIVNERMSRGKSVYTDEVIYAVGGLVTSEKAAGNAEAEHMHWNALVKLIEGRGGMQRIRQTSQVLEAGIHFFRAVVFCFGPRLEDSSIEYILPWVLDSPSSKPERYETLIMHLQRPLAHQEYHLELTLVNRSSYADEFRVESCEQFLSFLYLSCSNAQSKKSPLSAPTLFPLTRELIHLLVRMFPPRLSLLPTDSATPQTRPNVPFFASLTCLLFIRLTLFDLENQVQLYPGQLASYLTWLKTTLDNAFIYQCNSLLLMWLFWLHEGHQEDPDSPPGTGERPRAGGEGERNWFIHRILWVTNRLSPGSIDLVWNALLMSIRSVLVNIGRLDAVRMNFSDREESGSKTAVVWEEDELRKEILGGLYAGPPAWKESYLSEMLDDIGAEVDGIYPQR